MRKTSQDGGDTTSITSGVDNEAKKSITGIAKIKRNSIKKKVQGFSHESDDGVGEPLLQKDKEKPDFQNQSAKYLLSKAKTDSANEKMDDRDMLLPDNVIEKSAFTSFSGKKDNLSNGKQEGFMPYVCTANSIHNHMHINVFSSSEGVKSPLVPKTQVLIEIDGNKQSSFNSTGPLIFTTAKIHTDGKAMHMEPVQVTPVPILSTVEGSVIKTSSVSENDRKNIGTTSIKNIDPLMITGLTKITSDEMKPLGLPLKMNVPKTNTDSKTTNSFSSELKISTSKIPSNTTPIDVTLSTTVKPGSSTLDRYSQSSKEIPKSNANDIKNIGVTQEMDVNKNFQTGTSQSNITMNVTATTSTLTKTSKPIVTTVIVGKSTTSMATTSKSETPNFLPSTNTGTSTKSNVVSKIADKSTVTGNIKTSLQSNNSAFNPPTTATSTSTRAESVKETTFTMSNATPKPTNTVLTNKEVPKNQEIITKLPVSTTSRTPISTVSSPIKPIVSSINSTGKIAINTNKPITTTSSIITPTTVKSSVPTSTTTDKTVMTSSKPVSTTVSSAKTSTTISSIKPQTKSSSSTTISAKTSPSAAKTISSVASLQSTTVSSHIKSPISTTNSVVTTATKPLTTISKSTSSGPSPTTAASSYLAKSAAPVISSNLTSSGNPLKSNSKLISTTASSTTTALTTQSAGSKNTSPITPNMIPSTRGLSSNILTNKSSKGKDKPKDDVKVTSSVVPASMPAKLSTADISKTKNISSSPETVTAMKSVTSSDKSVNPSSSSGTAKVSTQAPATKIGSNTSSQTKASTKPASVPITAAASNQTSKSPAINKSNELQSNEHKKEKLK